MEATENIISKSGLIEASKKEDWGSLWLLLMAHTIRRLRYRYGIIEPKEKLASRARTYISEVQDLMFIKGTRNWNTDTYPTFKDFFISVIDSHLYNQIAKKSERETDFVENRMVGQNLQNPESTIIYDELRKQVFEMLEKEGADDDEMLVFSCMADDGITRPKDLRIELGISKEDFHNIWRKLNRKILKIQKKLGTHGY